MKRLFYISIFIFSLYSCKEKKNEKISDFTDQDAYEIVNLYIKEELKISDSSQVIFWNTRKLRYPEYGYTKIETPELMNLSDHPPPYPIFTKKYWDIDKILEVHPVTDQEYNYFFNGSYSEELEKLWDEKFMGKTIHNVSYPIYNNETKIAVLEDFESHPYLLCGTGLDNIYYFKRTENGWKKLR